MPEPTWPPQKTKQEQEQEHLRSIEALKSQKIDEQVALDTKERQFEDKLGKEKFLAEKREETLKAFDNHDTVGSVDAYPTKENTIWSKEKKEVVVEAQQQPSKESGFKKFWNKITGAGKKAAMIGAFGIAASSATASNVEKKPGDSTITEAGKGKIEKTKTDSTTKKASIPLYTQSKTVEGSITPTGFNNSFFENEYNITPTDLDHIAKKYNLDMTNAKVFQSQLIDILEKKDPKKIDHILEKYGETKYAQDSSKEGVEGLKDGKFGVRTAALVSALIEIDTSTTVHIEPTPEKDHTLEGGDKEHGTEVFNTNGYTSLDILFDVSPSMSQHKTFLAEKLKNNTSGIPVTVTGFTNKADTVMTFDNTSDASEYLKTIPLVDEDTELLLQTLEKKLQTMEKKVGGKGKIVGLTDELLQKVSKSTLDSLQKLSEEKNVDLSFTVMIGEQSYTLSLSDVQHAFDDIYKTEVLPEIQSIDAGIEIRAKQIADWQKELESTTDKTIVKNLKKNIEENQSEIKSFEERKKQKEMVNISNFDKNSDLVKR